jgi:glycosyltransferase involved in cell wall biosynthesis
LTVAVVLEYRFSRTPDGRVWTQVAFGYDFLRAHYVKTFGAVRVVARVREVEAVPADWLRADGPGVSFVAVPYYIGPMQYLRRRRGIARVLRRAVAADDALILRVPSILGTQVLSAQPPDRPFAVQVVGDPYDVFAPGATRHPLRPFFRWWFARTMRRQCARAAAASYVTARTLQQRYPCPGYTVAFSDVQLPDVAFVAGPRTARQSRPFTLVTIGSLENPNKAVDVLIGALARCAKSGLDARLVVVGGGRLQAGLEEQARSVGVADRVDFRGWLPAGATVRAVLDEGDLFVMASRTEGLPRALIEAMARALPCVGSAVGGIPELLPSECLVPPDEAAALAAKVVALAADPQRLAEMSARNLAAAGDFRDTVLRERRETFYGHVRELTERWLARRLPAAATP